MKRNRREQVDAALQVLRDLVPDVECRGLCHGSCTIVDSSVRERERLAEAGAHLPTMDEWYERLRTTDDATSIRCPLLGPDHRCTVYAERPMICRVWGAAESLPCAWGCRPAGGRLTDPEAMELLALSLAVGGDPQDHISARNISEVVALIRNHPIVGHLLDDSWAQDQRARTKD